MGFAPRVAAKLYPRLLNLLGAPEGARVPQGTSHKDFALFGAPSPLNEGP
jgi:hypothetical protein